MSIDTPLGAVVLFLVGIASGFMNVVAGGGSLLAVPALIFLGLPETVANGTSRIALIVQNVSAVTHYQRAGRLDLAALRRLAWPTLLGAAGGAALGAAMPDHGFRVVLAWIMLGCALLVVFSPSYEPALASTSRWRPAVVWPVFVLVGFYGGFIQAGIGYLLLLSFTAILGMELVSANILKVTLVLLYTPLALLIFIARGKVSLMPGLVLAAGMGLGGWLAAFATLRRGAGLIKVMLVVAVVLSSLELLGALDIVEGWITK